MEQPEHEQVHNGSSGGNAGSETHEVISSPPTGGRGTTVRRLACASSESRHALQRVTVPTALRPGNGHELVNVAVGSSEVLPSGSRFAQELDARQPQLRNRLRQIPDFETNNRAGLKMPFARVPRTEHLNVLSIGKFEDPKVRLGVNQF
jgi:hypothetical protein